MPGGSIMAAYDFPPPHHYHHVHLGFESAGTKSFTDLAHITVWPRSILAHFRDRQSLTGR